MSSGGCSQEILLCSWYIRISTYMQNNLDTKNVTCHRRHLCGKVTDAKIKNHFDLALPAHVRDNRPGAPLAQRHKLSLGIMIPLKEKLAAYLERPRGYCHVANILLVEGMLEQIRRQAQ